MIQSVKTIGILFCFNDLLHHQNTQKEYEDSVSKCWLVRFLQWFSNQKKMQILLKVARTTQTHLNRFGLKTRHLFVVNLLSMSGIEFNKKNMSAVYTTKTVQSFSIEKKILFFVKNCALFPGTSAQIVILHLYLVANTQKKSMWTILCG